jgi:transposase InsO family protein
MVVIGRITCFRLTGRTAFVQANPGPAQLELSKPTRTKSDYGVQYAAYGRTAVLQQRGVQVSMAAVGQTTKSAYAERVIRPIKEEKVYLAD